MLSGSQESCSGFNGLDSCEPHSRIPVQGHILSIGGDALMSVGGDALKSIFSIE
jgi:hypothetical protein